MEAIVVIHENKAEAEDVLGQWLLDTERQYLLLDVLESGISEDEVNSMPLRTLCDVILECVRSLEP